MAVRVDVDDGDLALLDYAISVLVQRRGATLPASFITLAETIRAARLDRYRQDRTRVVTAMDAAGGACERPRRDLLTRAELAARWRVTERTVDRRRAEGLPTVQVGRSVRFRLTDVTAWENRPCPRRQS